ncbi:MAG: indolepyruvate ferredoxin oxidoreductase subunit alpha [Nitrososphaeria archaeon]
MKFDEVIVAGKPGERHLLLGNEAIARGALEAGVAVCTGYPGTPASEVLDLMVSSRERTGVYAEYSMNEIVGLEVAGGASYSGLRSMAVMKHVGLNVAADAFFTLAYTGAPGGLIVLSADDPSAFSSQNEQDNRYYAVHASVPMLEPSTPQEAKDMLVVGMEISRRHEIPLLLRTSTRINHSRGIVELGERRPPQLSGSFSPNVQRFVAIPSTARVRHPVLLQQLEELEKESEESELNYSMGEGEEVGVITSGVTASYTLEALDELGVAVDVLKLGFTYPLPRKKIEDFLLAHKKVVVVEELEPYLEMSVKAIAYEAHAGTEILGKDLGIPRSGELGVALVKRSIVRALGLQMEEPQDIDTSEFPMRVPLLCAGCPHRASLYLLKKVFHAKDTIFSTDIGCYALGAPPPLSVGHTLLCMGGSVGVGMGMGVANKSKRVVSIIGDSTFFHAGIPGLINAVFNSHQLVVAVLDNLTTAMTGQQPTPTTGIGGGGTVTILPEKICAASGVSRVEVVNPLKVREAEETLRQLKQERGVVAVVLRAPCALDEVRRKRRSGESVEVYEVEEEDCRNCRVCVMVIDCPAIVSISEQEKPTIDRSNCVGCALCASICPYKAIGPRGERQP